MSQLLLSVYPTLVEMAVLSFWAGLYYGGLSVRYVCMTCYICSHVSALLVNDNKLCCIYLFYFLPMMLLQAGSMQLHHFRLLFNNGF